MEIFWQVMHPPSLTSTAHQACLVLRLHSPQLQSLLRNKIYGNNSLNYGFKMTFVIRCQTYKCTANKITASLPYPKLLQRVIVIGIDLVFHGAEVHWVCNNV